MSYSRETEILRFRSYLDEERIITQKHNDRFFIFSSFSSLFLSLFLLSFLSLSFPILFSFSFLSSSFPLSSLLLLSFFLFLSFCYSFFLSFFLFLFLSFFLSFSLFLSFPTFTISFSRIIFPIASCFLLA